MVTQQDRCVCECACMFVQRVLRGGVCVAGVVGGGVGNSGCVDSMQSFLLCLINVLANHWNV